GEELTTGREFAHAICECSDRACIARIERQYQPYLERMEAKYPGDTWPIEFQRIGNRVKDCEDRVEIADVVIGPIAANTGLPECDRDVEIFNAIETCDRVPDAAKLTLAKNLRLMQDAWTLQRNPNFSAS